MFRFLIQKLALIVPTVFGISLAAFAFVRLLPGDPILALAGERGVSPERYAELIKQFGYDRPYVFQYLDYIGNVLTGDFGISIATKRPVFAEFQALFPATLELATVAMIIAILIGIPAGIFAAVKRGSWFDQATMGVALTGYSMPIFWWGLLLIIFFSGYLGWTPVTGRIGLQYFFKPVTGFMLIDSLLVGRSGAFTSAVSHLILPSIVLATIPLAVIARQTRSAMLEVLGEDYVRTARAKGLGERGVVLRHALRNALIPIITVLGLDFGYYLTGSILTETIFSWPGLGRYVVNAITRRDLPAIQGAVLFLSTVFVFVNLLTDLAYAKADPRVAYD